MITRDKVRPQWVLIFNLIYMYISENVWTFLSVKSNYWWNMCKYCSKYHTSVINNYGTYFAKYHFLSLFKVILVKVIRHCCSGERLVFMDILFVSIKVSILNGTKGLNKNFISNEDVFSYNWSTSCFTCTPISTFMNFANKLRNVCTTCQLMSVNYNWTLPNK